MYSALAVCGLWLSRQGRTMDEKSKARARALCARLLQAFEVATVEALDNAAKKKRGDVEFDLMVLPSREIDALMSQAAYTSGVWPFNAGDTIPSGSVRVSEEGTGMIGRLLGGFLDGCEVVVFKDDVATSTIDAGTFKEGMARRVRSGLVPVEKREYIADSLLLGSMAARLFILGCAEETVGFLQNAGTDGEKAAKVTAELAAARAMISAGVRPFGQDGPVLLEGGAS